MRSNEGLLHRRGIMSTCLLITGFHTYTPPACEKKPSGKKKKKTNEGEIKKYHNHRHHTLVFMLCNESL